MGRARGLGELLAEQLDAAQPTPRELTGQELIEQRAAGEEVRRGAQLAARGLLGGHVADGARPAVNPKRRGEAEQVSNPQARTAFLEHATSVTSIKANYSSSATRSAPSTRLDAPPLPEALLDAAQRLLAQHMGPIAKVVVKKAAGRTSDRAAFFALLADNLPDGTARQKLLGDLQRLT